MAASALSWILLLCFSTLILADIISQDCTKYTLYPEHDRAVFVGTVKCKDGSNIQKNGILEFRDDDNGNTADDVHELYVFGGGKPSEEFYMSITNPKQEPGENENGFIEYYFVFSNVCGNSTVGFGNTIAGHYSL